MDARSGSENVNDRRNRQIVRQTYRAVHTQPDRPEGQDRGSFLNELAEGTSCPEVQEVPTSLARTSSSASSSASDRGGGTSTSAGRELSPSPSVASLSSEKSTLNPHAKEFKLSANAKSFTPFQTPRPSFSIADNSVYYPRMATATHMHGMPSSVGAGPSFAAQPPVMHNTPAAPMLQQIYNPSGPQAVNSRQPKFTHFVSLPLAIYPELLKKLVDFKIAVLGEAAADSGIEKSIFAILESIHLTVLMLELSNEEQFKTATEAMQSASSKVMDALENRPLFIKLKGLECFRDFEDKPYLVYAPVEVIGGKERLLCAYDVINDAFVRAGLAVGYDRKNLKLHVTLMSTRFRTTMKEKPFDARAIFKRYGNEEWGEYRISEAHLSKRGEFMRNGYYLCCASLPFP
ncbi:uncharacterized protein LOC121772731 isoform X2 [Salvia splendens]|uniref:uncharacterized protein LOC121772731 isoform X2 n=1 Tax=Salvia splendens TaxID=180675 RepID=UPI001C25F94B|nr:uncharacterized protein LOC121772731 isoform X2 [Salvia splendens]